MDLAKQLLHEHFTAILATAAVLCAVLLTLVVLLFHEFVAHYERTKRAMVKLVQSIVALRKAAKGDATADDELAKTISQPMDAVPNPKRESKP